MSASRIEQANKAMEKYHGQVVLNSPAIGVINSPGPIGRFLVLTTDREDIYATIADTLGQAEQDLAGQIQEEVAWAPVEVVDLDSGDSLSVQVSCSLSY